MLISMAIHIDPNFPEVIRPKCVRCKADRLADVLLVKNNEYMPLCFDCEDDILRETALEANSISNDVYVIFMLYEHAVKRNT